MKNSKIRIATRKSQLALWQTHYVASQLKQHYPDIGIELIEINTRGDQIQDRPLRDVGGKALFVKGLEEALLDDQADIAVHSMKDVPSILEGPFALPAICQRANPFDAFVSNRFKTIDELPKNATVGSSSPRRQAQLLAYRPDLKLVDLRGNVNTRLAKLDTNEFDAIILACAGLERLGFAERISQQLPPAICLPAASQGAVGIEILDSRQDLQQLLQPLNHQSTHTCIEIERAICAGLEGDCHSPIAVFAQELEQVFRVKARVCSPDGQTVIEANYTGDQHQAIRQVLEQLNEQGVQSILAIR